MSPEPTHPLAALVSTARRPPLIVHDGSVEAALDGLPRDGVVLRHLEQEIPGAPRRWPAVALVVADAVALRRAASALRQVGGSRVVAWWLLDADEPALVLPRPEWPPVSELDGRRVGAGGLTVMRTDGPVGVKAVLCHVARTLATASSGHHGVVVATTDRAPASAPPADASLLVVETTVAASDPTLVVPPDVVLSREPSDAPLPEHHVIARAPVVVTDPDLLAGPLDEGLLNPIGFLREPAQGVVSLRTGPDDRMRLVGAGVDLELRDGQVAPSTVSALRAHSGVDVEGTSPPSAALVRAVAGLAMAGVPLVGARSSLAPTGGPGPRLGPALTSALAGIVDLTDPVSREEHSIRVRRAALHEHSAVAWRQRLGASAGVDVRALPTVSALVWSRTSSDLGRTLRHLDRQRGADLELIGLAHGFSPQEVVLPEGSGRDVTMLEVDPTRSMSDALAAGLAAASGDVVAVMDATWWYGTDVVADLLLARRYTGAAVVGTAGQLVHDDRRERTLRRGGESERWVTSVADGPWVIGRRYLRELGGFTASGWSLAGLADDVSGRGHLGYVTHGLGLALRFDDLPADDDLRSQS